MATPTTTSKTTSDGGMVSAAFHALCYPTNPVDWTANPTGHWGKPIAVNMLWGGGTADSEDWSLCRRSGVSTGRRSTSSASRSPTVPLAKDPLA